MISTILHPHYYNIMQEKIKVAILDMYDGEPNQGMRCIHDIINRFADDLTFKVYDLRGKAELPNIEEYNLYLFS